MSGQRPDPQIDSLLLLFLQTTDEAEAQRQLDQLIAHAAPVIKKITSWSRDPEDAFQEATQQVIKRLWGFKADPAGKAISNYPHYVKVVASHVAKGQLREERPQRRSLADALRHVLKSEPRFATWEDEAQERLCGLAAWRDQQAGLTRGERSIRPPDDPQTLAEVILPGRDARELGHADLLAEIFNWVGHPIRFDELFRLVCDLRRIKDFTPFVASGEEGARPLSERLPDAGPLPDEEAAWGEFLERLWAEIGQLPPLQRLAYLLNFTAADGQLELFWTHGVATLRRIGAALQLTDEQFARVWPELPLNDAERRRAQALGSYDEKFTLLWQHLPLTDAAIANMLGTERQKVINLRKAAGNRLSRRLAHGDRSA